MASFLDICVRDRFTNPVELPFSTVVVSFCANILYSFYLLLNSNRKQICLLKLVSIHGLFIAGVFVSYALKSIISDTLCNDKPNSVSGHAFFGVYFFIVWIMDYAGHSKIQPKIKRILLILVNSSLVLTTSFTYYGGYHTLRQMLYGAALALAFACLYFVLAKLLTRVKLASVVAVVLSICVAAGFKLTAVNTIDNVVIYQAAAWPVLFIISLFVYNSGKIF